MSTWTYPRNDRCSPGYWHWLAYALLLLLLSTVQANAQNPSNTQTLLLAVRLNGVDQLKLIEVIQIGDRDLAIDVDTLRQWQFKLPATDAQQIDGAPHFRLSAYPGLTWRIDSANQLLIIDAPASAYQESEVSYGGNYVAGLTPASSGLIFNYDLQSDFTGQTRSYNGLLEAGLFNQYGIANSTGLWRNDSTLGESFTRLDTQWKTDLPARQQSIRLGDSIGQAGSWGRAVRFGGIQWGTNFGTTPGFLPFALPTIRGEAALPSTLDLYINDAYRLQGNVTPGPFSLPNVPIVTGQGEIRLNVKDLLGREHTVIQPYYVSPGLLKQGLSEFSAELGAIRRNYGFVSNDYGPLVANLNYRRGLNDRVTGEVRTEVQANRQTLGLAANTLVAQYATVNAFAAGSQRTGQVGGSTGFGVDRQSRQWSANAQMRYNSREFMQNGLPTDGTQPRITASLSIGLPWQGGGVGASQVYQKDWLGQDSRIFSLNFGRSAGKLGFLNAFVSQDVRSGTRNNTIGVTLIHLLGERTSASASLYGTGSQHQGSLQLQQNVPDGVGSGYMLNADHGMANRVSAQGALQTEHTSLLAGVAQLDGRSAYRLGASGGVALTDNDIYFSRRIQDSFAVVQVADYAGVRVNRDNQTVARTDEHGRAFVSGLRGYENNRISIEANDLPFDAEIDNLDMAVVPPMRSGVKALFPVRRVRSANVRLVDAGQVPLAAGSVVRLVGSGLNFTVGFDGKVFLNSFAQSDTPIRLRGKAANASCDAVIDQQADEDSPMPNWGTVVCR